MNESFIAGDVSLRKYKKLSSQMKRQVDDIEAVIGYRKWSLISQKKQASKQQKIRSKTLVENFTAMKQSFEDILKPIEDPVIREWMARIDSESRSSSLNTVSIEFIHEFVIKIMSDFNEMMASSKLPNDTFADAAKTKLDNFQKGQIVKEIEDSLANLATFVVLIDQIKEILLQCKFIVGKDRVSLEKLLERYEMIAKRSSSNILGQIQKLLIYDLKSLLTQESKQMMLQKLKEIEDNLLTSDIKKDLQNYASSVIESSNLTNPQKVLFPSVTQNESPPRVYSAKPSFQGILMSHKNSVNYLAAATGQSETFGVSPKISDKEAREKELREKIQNETNRIVKAGQLVKRCQGTQELQAMIKILSDVGTTLALQDLIPKNSLEKHIYLLVQQQQSQSIKITFSQQFQAIIDAQKAIIVSAFSILESQGSQFNQPQPLYRRYLGDGGMITHRHFLLNKDNLVPIFKQLDPVTFSEDPPESRVNLVKKQREMTQKHIDRIKKQKMSTSTFSSSTLTRGRNCTIKSNTNTDYLDVSQNSKIRGDRANSSSSRTRFKSATNEGTQGQLKGKNEMAHEGKTLDYYKSLLASSGQIEQRGNSSASIPALNQNKIKDNLSSSVVIAKKRGLAEYFVQKNLSRMNQQILSAINQNFDASNINEKLIKQDEEQKFLIDSSNRLPDIQQKRASILQSNNRKQQQIFNRSQANSMAECSQENSSSNDDSSSYQSLDEASIEQKSANQTGKISHLMNSDTQQRHTLKYDIGQIYHEMPSNLKSTMILIENNSIDLHSLRRTEATSELTSALNHSPYVKHKFVPRKSNSSQRTSEIKHSSGQYYDEDSIFARTDNKEKQHNPFDSVENTESKVLTSEEKESGQKEILIEGNEKEFVTPSKLPAKRKSEYFSHSLKKRSEIIDRVNASFMPKYIHEHSSKVITKTNPKMLRYLLGSFKKREMELLNEARENMNIISEAKCYGVEELAFKPKDHNFCTSSLQSTYEDIKTTKILQHTKM